jgi:hypothetical protein
VGRIPTVFHSRMDPLNINGLSRGEGHDRLKSNVVFAVLTSFRGYYAIRCARAVFWCKEDRRDILIMPPVHDNGPEA